jgi:hypothetical protein
MKRDPLDMGSPEVTEKGIRKRFEDPCCALRDPDGLIHLRVSQLLTTVCEDKTNALRWLATELVPSEAEVNCLECTCFAAHRAARLAR